MNILGKHSLDLPGEHPSHRLGQLLTCGLGMARVCYPKLQNAARFGGFTRIQSSSCVRGRNPQWLGASLSLAPPVCRGLRSSQPYFKYFLRNQSLPDLCLLLACFSLCTSDGGKGETVPFPLILFLKGWEESHFTESQDGLGWKGTLKIIVFNLVPSPFSLARASEMPLSACTASPQRCSPSHFLTKGPERILMNPARQISSTENSSRTLSTALSNSVRLWYLVCSITWGSPEHKNMDVVGVPAGRTAPKCTADRQSAVCAPPHTQDHWNKQVRLDEPTALSPSIWTPWDTLQMQGFKPD